MTVMGMKTAGASQMMSPNERVLAILAFHKIGEPSEDGWDSWYYIPEATFADQLRYLKENRWQGIDLATFLLGLAEPRLLPARAALLTFDDGYRSILDVALPWLLRFEYPAVLFVPTEFIGGRNSFDIDQEPEELICDWSHLWELEQHSVSVQSHGVSHRAFSELDISEREYELSRSKAALEEGLKKQVEVFSFPYGDDGPDPKGQGDALARAGYRAACLYGGSPFSPSIADPFRLPRVAMGPDTDLETEMQLISGTVG